MLFDWDPAKAAENYKKHHVSFEEASLVFKDPYAVPVDDAEHADRMNLIGFAHRMLFVVYVEISEDGIARIISARKATKKEKKRYENAER